MIHVILLLLLLTALIDPEQLNVFAFVFLRRIPLLKLGLKRLYYYRWWKDAIVLEFVLHILCILIVHVVMEMAREPLSRLGYSLYKLYYVLLST